MIIKNDAENVSINGAIPFKNNPSNNFEPEKKITFNIQNISSSGDFINNLMSQVDKTFYLQMDHSNNIKFSYIFLLLILFLFN